MDGRDFEVWQLPTRGKKHAAPWSQLRRQPGLPGRWIPGPISARAAAVRRLALLEAPGHLGHRTTLNWGAAPGYSAAGYQWMEIAFGQCDASRGILPLSAGSASKGRAAAKPRSLVRREKVGFRPCCTAAIHVAVTATFAWGEFPAQKARGVDLW